MSITRVNLDVINEEDLLELQALYDSMKSSIIDIARMDDEGVLSLKQFVYEYGKSGDILRMNVNIHDTMVVTDAIFVEDGYEASEITDNLLLPFEGKYEDQYVTIDGNKIQYHASTNNVEVDGTPVTFGDSFFLGGRRVTLARGSIVLVIEDSLPLPFPEEGLQSEIIKNNGTMVLGDVTTSSTILIESKNDSGDTIVTNYILFRDTVTDQRTCAIEYIKSVNLLQTIGTSTVNMGYVDNTDTRSLEKVLQYTSEETDIRSVNQSGEESIATVDVDGISFSSDNAGLILGDNSEFGIFYDSVTGTLQIKHYDTLSSQYVTKREFGN